MIFQVMEQNSLQPADQWMAHMRRGDWEAAWRVSDRVREARRGRQPRDASGEWLPRHLQWVWDGSSLTAKRVLVRCYHGLGDTIQFVRFIPLLRQTATHVTLLAQAQLLPLLEPVAGVDALAELDDPAYEGDYDIDIEVMELAHAFRVTPATLPATIPYIQVNAQPHRRVYGARPRVGLVWQSGTWDVRRSIPAELMRALTELEGIDFQILQRGPALAGWSGARAAVPPIGNIVEEAAELRALDLLICVDTLSAHLAGALGVKTWTLLPRDADWRWMEDREDTPWYPTMRLFRQSPAGDWESVLARVGAELIRELSGAASHSAAADRGTTALS